jgi:hypothetical protein
MLKAKKERVAQLNDEQRKIYQGWIEEEEKIQALTKKLMETAKTATLEEVEDIANQLDALVPNNCEHGRSIWSSCIACDKIEMILYPEFFDEDGVRKDDDECERIAQEIENAYKLN